MHTGFPLSLLAPAKLTVKGLKRPAPRIGQDKLVAWALISQQSCSSSRRPSGKQCWADNSAENCFGKRTLKLWLVVTGLALETAGLGRNLGKRTCNLMQTWRLCANLAEARGWRKPARNLPKPGGTWRKPGGTRRKKSKLKGGVVGSNYNFWHGLCSQPPTPSAFN